MHMKSTRGPIDVRVLQDRCTGISNLDFSGSRTPSSPMKSASSTTTTTLLNRSPVYIARVSVGHFSDYDRVRAPPKSTTRLILSDAWCFSILEQSKDHDPRVRGGSQFVGRLQSKMIDLCSSNPGASSFLMSSILPYDSKGLSFVCITVVYN